MESIVVALVIVAVIVAVWIARAVGQTHRDSALEKAAGRLGLHFRFGLPPGLRESLSRFRVIENAQEAGGDFQAGINSITGTLEGRSVAFFDFQWTTVVWSGVRRAWWSGWGRSSNEYRIRHLRSAVAVQLSAPAPPILIRPERLVDKALALVGYEDIDFPELPEFSSAFYVNSPDRGFARRLVTPDLARFFMEHVRRSVDVAGSWILLHGGSAMAASEVGEAMALARRIAEFVERAPSGSR